MAAAKTHSPEVIIVPSDGKGSDSLGHLAKLHAQNLLFAIGLAIVRYYVDLLAVRYGLYVYGLAFTRTPDAGSRRLLSRDQAPVS